MSRISVKQANKIIINFSNSVKCKDIYDGSDRLIV